MKTQVSVKNLKLSDLHHHVINKKIKKITRLCKIFKPDLVAINLAIEQHKLPIGFVTHLNLSVPSHQLAAITKNKKFSISLTEAFKKVISQLKKYRSKLTKTDGH